MPIPYGLILTLIFALPALEANAALTCPVNYILVDSSDPTLPSFCVAKFEMKNVGGVARSQADGLPWASLDRFQAVAACEALGADYKLISNSHWQLVATAIENTPANWSGGAVGSGAVNSGHSDQNPYMTLAASTDDALGCFGKSCSSGSWDLQRRTHALPHGVIWDFSGNVTEWVSDNNFTNYGINAPAASAALRSSPFLQKNYATTGNYTAIANLVSLHLGQSKLQFANGAMARGAHFVDTTDIAGIYSADSSVSQDTRSELLGFRCVYQPAIPRTASITCPANFIAVEPAAPAKPFCVAKFEMKQDGDTAVSKAAGFPFTNINRDEAKASCAALGSGYGLLRNSEWQAIANEIEATPANWSGGTVGNGAVSVGHADQAPYHTLEASTDDRQSCIGTGETCDSSLWNRSKRTHQLSFGTIWDLAGNASEWMAEDNTVSYGWQGYAADPVLAQLSAVKAQYGAKFSYPSPQDTGLGFLKLQFANGGIIRGGSFNETTSLVGIYSTDTSASPDIRLEQVGFRCAFRPHEVNPPTDPDPNPAFDYEACVASCNGAADCKKACDLKRNQIKKAEKSVERAVRAAERAARAADRAAKFAAKDKNKAAQAAAEAALKAAKKAALQADIAKAYAALSESAQADAAAAAAEAAADAAELSALTAATSAG